MLFWTALKVYFKMILGSLKEMVCWDSTVKSVYREKLFVNLEGKISACSCVPQFSIKWRDIDPSMFNFFSGIFSLIKVMKSVKVLSAVYKDTGKTFNEYYFDEGVFEAVLHVLGTEKFSGSEGLVFLAMIELLDCDSGCVTESIHNISRFSGISLSSIRKSIHSLLEKQIICKVECNKDVMFFVNPFALNYKKEINETLYQMFKSSKYFTQRYKSNKVIRFG